MSWLYLHFPNLQLELVQNNYHEQDVLVVLDSKTNKVVQYNDAAKKLGISLGIGLASTLALHRDIQLIEYDPTIEERKLEQIANLLYQATAEICLNPPKGLFLKTSNMMSLYHDINSYWQRINSLLKSTELTFSYALANTPLAAQLLAENRLTTSLNDTAQLPQPLLALPIEQLRLSDKTIQSLLRVGLKTLGQLLTISLKELAQRFPLELLHFIGKVTGELKPQLNYYQPPLLFNTTLELNYEISHTTKLLPPISTCLSKLELFLMKRNLISPSLEFRFRQANNSTILFLVNSAQGLYQQTQWLALIKLQLETLILSAPIRAIELFCCQFITANIVTQQLFSGGKAGIEPSQLIDILQAKLGSGHVFKLSYRQQHHPVLSNQLYDLGQHKTNDVTTTPSAHQLKLRPCYLLATPTPLLTPVAILQGPERLETNWWDEHGICRDYFIGKNAQGQLCWLFRQPDNKWFIHGYFG